MRHLSCTCFFVCLLCSLSASGEYIYHASQGVPGPRFNSVDEACRYYEGNKYRPKYNKVYLLNRSFTTYPYGTSFLMTQCAYEHLGQIERFHTIYSVRLESCYDYAPYWNPKDLICSSKNYCDDLEGETAEFTISKKRLKEGDISKLMVNTCIAHISSLNCSINESGEEICQVEAVYTGDPGDNTLERSIDITGNNTNLNENGTGDCSSPDTTPAAGNPVRIATGNKYHFEALIENSLSLEITYNSNDGKWHHNFNYVLNGLENTAQFKKYTRPDGQVLFFENTNAEWKPLEAGAIQLSSTSAHGAAWLVNYYGQHEYYDDQGRILRIEKPQGTVQTFTWSGQQLAVQDQQSNRLTLTFDDKKRLVSAVQPNGKPTTLAWSDDDKLLKVTKSDGSIRQYHYENSTFPKHLTGITDGNGKRFATWKYDIKGRAISSEHAGGTEKTSLEYHANNSTTVTNPLGKKTTYHFKVFNGVHKVVKVEGQQTEHCAAANKAYTYYDNGLLKTKTDWKGIVTAFEYNDRGLAIETTEAVGTPQARTVTTEWDVDKRLPLKITDSKVETSYQYDEQGALVKKTESLIN